ncbi:uncharacterized protein LOC134824191 isoform X2 [Bolinopsis microptera]|uniref:uncharacterized protein LOC134824191 isoform X2 n=1 Tax=Bolinopsis microptera TaxID=2820187 RepID=UPI003078AE65
MLNSDEHSPPPPPPLAMKNLQAKTTMDLSEPGSVSPLSIKRSPLLPRRTPSPHRTRSRTPSPSSVSNPSSVSKSPTVSQRNKIPSPSPVSKSPTVSQRNKIPSPSPVSKSPTVSQRNKIPSPSPVSKSPTVSQRNKKAPAAAAAAAGLKLRSLVTVWRFVKRTYNRTRRTSPLPEKELRISVVGNLVKNCTETFLSEEGTVRGSSAGDTESNVSAANRRFSSDSGNSSGEEYPYFIGKQCREYLDNPANDRSAAMSCDESDLLDHLDWINDLDEATTLSNYSCITPRYKREEEYVNNLKIVSWWEFYSNESNLNEWDDEVQFYDEETDTFRKWANKHDLDFETVSLLRSLHLDDTVALSKMNHHQLAALKSKGSIKKLTKALSSLTLEPTPNRVEFQDDIFSDDNLNIVDDKEFNLRPKLSRNLPHRRSTRSGKKASKNIHVRGDGIRTVGPGATRPRHGYHDSRRLSWEHFTFFNHNKPNSAPSSSNVIDRPVSVSAAKASPTPSPKAKHKIEHFKFPSDKKDKLTNKKSKALFPSVTPV